MGVTVVIPSKGLNAILSVCIAMTREAFEAAGIADYRVVVVDNASPYPYLPEEFGAGVEIIRFDKPQSFSRACNTGADCGPDDDVFLLNNDVLLHREAIADLRETMQAARADICGARLVFPDGRIQHCGVRIGGPRPVPYHTDNFVPSRLVSRTIRQQQAVTGAVMWIRGPVFRELGGLDEIYPFAYEDVDFCLRARSAGYRISCAQRVDSIHFSSMTPGRFTHEDQSRNIFEQRWAGRTTTDADDGLYL